MSKGIIKPSQNELREDIKAIVELPERLETLNAIRLKELLIYLDKETLYKIDSIEKLMIANHNTPNGEFDFLASNLRQDGLTLNDLKILKKLIKAQLISLQCNTTPQHENEIINQVFKTNGFELFNYLDENFKTLNDKLTIKYSLLHYFLFDEVKYIFQNQKKYIEFVQTFCSEKLKKGKNVKFARIENNLAFDDHKKKHIPTLTELYNTFK